MATTAAVATATEGAAATGVEGKFSRFVLFSSFAQNFFISFSLALSSLISRSHPHTPTDTRAHSYGGGGYQQGGGGYGGGGYGGQQGAFSF